VRKNNSKSIVASHKQLHQLFAFALLVGEVFFLPKHPLRRAQTNSLLWRVFCSFFFPTSLARFFPMSERLGIKPSENAKWRKNPFFNFLRNLTKPLTGSFFICSRVRARARASYKMN
jgi:hypothetical protein